MYLDPQYFRQEQQDLPPEYDEDEFVDYALDEEDQVNYIQDELGLIKMTLKNKQSSLKWHHKGSLNITKKINEAKFKRNQLKGFKSHVPKAYNAGKINEAQKI